MWIDDIPALAPADYQRLQDRWFAHLAASDGVVAYGSFGSIGAPGLSDLDLVAVVDDRALGRGALRLLDLDDRERLIMVHPPLVIPRSLYPALPLYHPVSIRWQHGGDEFGDLTTEPIVGRMHVLEKTLFVQGRLLRAGAGDRSLRRLFLMLTSLARSVEWTERSGQTPTPDESAYAAAILELRAEWLADTGARPGLEASLEALLDRARVLAVTLPERLAGTLLDGSAAPPLPWRALQIRPRQFVRQVTGELSGAVAAYPRPRGGWRGRLDGEWRLAGPQLFRFLLARCAVERANEAVAWPLRVGSSGPEAALARFPEPVRETLTAYTRANVAYARILTEAGLSAANFGTIWSATGWRRLVHRVLANLPAGG